MPPPPANDVVRLADRRRRQRSRDELAFLPGYGALLAFLDGKSLEGIRRAGAQAYADGERKAIGRVGYAFVNPSDKSWKLPMPEVITIKGSGSGER